MKKTTLAIYVAIALAGLAGAGAQLVASAQAQGALTPGVAPGVQPQPAGIPAPGMAISPMAAPGVPVQMAPATAIAPVPAPVVQGGSADEEEASTTIKEISKARRRIELKKLKAEESKLDEQMSPKVALPAQTDPLVQAMQRTTSDRQTTEDAEAKSRQILVISTYGSADAMFAEITIMGAKMVVGAGSVLPSGQVVRKVTASSVEASKNAKTKKVDVFWISNAAADVISSANKGSGEQGQRVVGYERNGPVFNPVVVGDAPVLRPYNPGAGSAPTNPFANTGSRDK